MTVRMFRRRFRAQLVNIPSFWRGVVRARTGSPIVRKQPVVIRPFNLAAPEWSLPVRCDLEFRASVSDAFGPEAVSRRETVSPNDTMRSASIHPDLYSV